MYNVAIREAPLKRIATAAALVLLVLPVSLHPCSRVYVGGIKPYTVGQISGTVVGNGVWDPMGNQPKVDPWSIVVPGARVVLFPRTNIKVVQASDVLEENKATIGNLYEWKCGDREVASTASDDSGKFALPSIDPGTYCLVVTGPEPKREMESQMRAKFVVDVVKPEPKAKLLVNITPGWADCSGGSSIRLKPED